jgi:hypothetical protein
MAHDSTTTGYYDRWFHAISQACPCVIKRQQTRIERAVIAEITGYQRGVDRDLKAIGRHKLEMAIKHF